MSSKQACENSRRLGIYVKENAPRPLGAYSHAVAAGGFLFLSGQGARNPETGIEEGITVDTIGRVMSYDIKVQTHAVIKNIQAVLAEAGLALTDLVDVSVFLSNMDDFAQFNEVYTSYFSFPEPPARTTVQAAKLPGKNFIEIKGIALLKQKESQ